MKIWPRSRSPASCTSSIATNEAFVSRGIASTVQTEKRGIGRRDLLLAGDQRHAATPTFSTTRAIDLARQEPQRQADHAGAMRHHALDGIMGLAGVGRAEHRGDAAPAEDHGLEIQSLVPRIT